MLAVNNSFPARSLAEFRAQLLANPNRFDFGSSGNGTTGHIAAALMLHLMGRAGAACALSRIGRGLPGLLARRTAFQADTISFLTEPIRTGRCAPGDCNPQRSPMIPDVPTAAEAGLPDFQATTWTPWSATLGTPAPIRQFLFEQITEVLRTPEVRDRLIALATPSRRA